MRSIEEQMSEIRRKSSLYREKKQIRRLSLLAAGIGVLLITNFGNQANNKDKLFPPTYLAARNICTILKAAFRERVRTGR